MNEQELEVAGFYARLASVEDLNALRKGERLNLQEDFAALAADASLIGAHFVRMRASAKRRQPKVRSGEMAGGMRFTWQEFENASFAALHERCRTILGGLVDGEVVEIDVRPFWHVVNGKLSLTWGEAAVEAAPGESDFRTTGQFDWLGLAPLLKLIQRSSETHHTFPFARCSQCRHIFVQGRGRRRRFCSPNCMVQGVEAARHDQKREYMRTYMAKRRAKEKRRRQEK